MKPKIKWHPTVRQYACQGNGRTGWGDTIPKALQDYESGSWSGRVSDGYRVNFGRLSALRNAGLNVEHVDASAFFSSFFCFPFF